MARINLDKAPAGGTLLTGYVVDQAALYGVLMKIRDLGLTLISVQRLETNWLVDLLGLL